MSLVTNVQDLATRVGTEVKSIRVLVNGNQADLSALTTSAKSNLVAAINEVKASTSSAAGINDATTSTSSTWSSSKTSTELAGKAPTSHTHTSSAITDFASAVDARINNVVAGAPAALDTLDELAAAIGDDPSFGATITTALGNRVRFDAAQTLSGPQATQARSNIGAAAASDLGVVVDGSAVLAFESALT